MAKQIIIDYDEYLKLEKAKKQVDNIQQELKSGAMVIKQTFENRTYRDPMALCEEPKFKTEFILTSGLQTILEDIGYNNEKSE